MASLGPGRRNLSLIVAEVTITCCDGTTHDKTYTIDITFLQERLDEKYPLETSSEDGTQKWHDELWGGIYQGIGEDVAPDMDALCPAQCMR